MKSLRLSLFLAALVAVCSAAPPPADGTINLQVYDATAGVWRGKLIPLQNGKVLGPAGGVWGLQAGGGGGSSVWGGLSGNITDQTDLMTQLALRAALSGATFTGGVTAPGFTGPLTGNVTGNITGNAGTATALQTPRTINGVTFAGTANITVPAAAETLTGSALPALNGSALTNLSGSAIASGNINYARLGTSLATAGTFLSGTGTTPQWRSLAANDIILAQGLLGNVVSGGTAGGQVIPIMPPLGFSGGNMVLSYAAPLYLDGANLALAVTNGGNGVADSGKVLQLDGNGSAAINNLTAASVAATSLDVGISGATTGIVYLYDAASSYTVQLQPESGLTGYRPVIFPDEPSAPEWKVAYKWWVQNQGYLAAANNLSDVANAGVALANLTGEVAANLVFAGPNTGGNDNPAFRSLVATDLPLIDINNGITGGPLNVSNGGTGASTLSGLVKGNGTSAFGQAKADDVASVLYAADAGANDTYAITISPAPSAYTTGTHYRFKANTSNTGAATLNVNSLGAKTIKKAAGGITTDLADNDIRSGQFVDVVYDGTNFQMQSTLGNAASGGSGTPGGSDTQIQFNDSGAFGGVAGLTVNKTTGAVTQLQTSLGTTSAAGLTLSNTTAAAAGAQQVSPALDYIAQGWKTTATAASQQVQWRQYVLPVQGSSAPTATMVWQYGVNGGALADIATLTSTGNFSLAGGKVSTTAAVVGGSNNTSGGVGVASAGRMGFDSGSSPVNTSSLDAFLTRSGAANIQLGSDAASPTAQTLSVADVSSGTSNTAGAIASLDGSQGTGTGNGGSYRIRTAPPGSSGTTQNTLAPRYQIYGGEKSLTESTASTVLNIALASSKYLGGCLTVTTCADDGTDFQAVSEVFSFSAINKAGTVTATIQATPGSSTTAASAGTLTTTWTIAANGNSVDIKNNAVSSLTQTSLKVSYQIHLNTNGTGVITE